MINANIIKYPLLAAGTIGVKELDNVYAQWGAIGILFIVLGWYSFQSWKENIRRDKIQEQEKTKLIENHKEEIKTIVENYTKQIELLINTNKDQLDASNDRYHEMNIELMAFLKGYKHE